MAKSKRDNHGKDFEDALRLQFGLYEKRGIATVEKVEPPVAMRCIGAGQFRPVLLKNPFLDFVGTWTANGGRALFIEAKSTAEPRLPCPSETGIKPEQIASLQRWHASGAFVAVLWLWRGAPVPEARIVTLKTIETAKAQGRQSIAWADALVVPSGLPHQLYTADFLTAMLSLAKMP